MRRLDQLFVCLIGVLLVISPAVATAPTNAHFIASGTRFHVVGGDNSYLFLGSDAWADKVQVAGGGTYTFTNAALGTASSPTQTFGVRLQSTNATLTAIATNYVTVQPTAKSLATAKVFFYYTMPQTVSTSPARVVITNVLGAQTTITNSQYLTSPTTFSTCAAPCIFVNAANTTLIIKQQVAATASVDTIWYIVSSQATCNTVNSTQNQVASAITLLAVGLVVLVATVLLVLIKEGLTGGGGGAELGDQTTMLPVLIIFLVVGVFMIFALYAAVTGILGC